MPTIDPTAYEYAKDLLSAQVTNTLLWGPPGYGKSWAARNLGLRPGQGVEIITCSPDAIGSEQRGGIYPIPGAQGTWDWLDGPVLRAMRAGSRLVCEEIGRAGEDLLAFALAAADSVGTLAIQVPTTGETVIAAPGYHVVATSNTAPDRLPKALASRFVALHIEHPAPTFAARALTHDDVRTLYESADLDFAQPREWLHLDRLYMHGLDFQRAATIVLGPERASSLTLTRHAADAEIPRGTF